MSDKQLKVEIELLSQQLRDANATIDALKAAESNHDHVHSEDRSDGFHRFLVENTQQGAASLSEDGTIVYCNARFANLLGVAHGQICDINFADFVSPPDQVRYEALLQQALAGASEGEIALLRADGSLYPVLLTLSALAPHSRGAVGLLVTDLTKQKPQEELNQAIDKLRESESQFRQLADSIPQLVWTADAEGYIDWFNRRWYDYTATTLGEMEGWGWQSIHDPEVLPSVLEKWKESLATGESFEMTFPLRGADGNYRPFLTRVTPVHDTQGAIIRWFGTNTDISKERESQLELRNIAAKLSEADRRKDAFLATLAHELRNPLSPIKTASQLMQLVGDDATQLRELSEVIDRQVAHMVRLIDDLMDVSRISRGKIRLRLEMCDLREVIASATEAVASLFSESDQTLRVEIADQALKVKGDKARLVQVLVNLLNNAGKYTPDAGNIWLSVGQVDGRALIQVRDDGVGLSEENLEAIFEMFAQVDGAKERGQSGLGIGLSLARSLVELHEGQLTAESDGLGCGSTFAVRLPLIGTSAQAVPHAEPEAEDLKAVRPVRVLVVEDTRTIRFMISRLLSTMGHEVAEAADGQEALDVARRFKPEVIFSDISMPVMNGYELARKIRASTAFDGVQLVALTGYGQESDRMNALESGFNDHIVKPVDARVLSNFFSKLSGPSQ